MTKSELIESYTMEQLADMVIEKYDKARSEEKPYGAHYDLENGKAIRFIGFEKGESDSLFAWIDERLNAEPISLYPSEKLLREIDEIKELKSQLDHKQTEIDQIDEILNELFGVTHDVAKPAEFEKILREKADGYKTVSDFLPTEPIAVASILINTHKRTIGGNAAYYNKMFDISELRQIAEHLLVYCNANGSEGEGMIGKSKHKLGIRLPDSGEYCAGIQVYIDEERINAMSLTLPKRGVTDGLDKIDLEFNVAKLEVRDIEDIALLMNRETFDRFCELWRKYHEE